MERPTAFRDALAEAERGIHKAQIFGRRPLEPTVVREVPVFVQTDAGFERRMVRVGRAIRVDEIMVAVYEDVSDKTPAQLESFGRWHPQAPRLMAREVLKDVKRARATVAPPLVRDEILFDARWSDPNNMAHLVVNMLPWALFAQQTLDEPMLSVFVEVEGPFREVLDVLGIRYIESSLRLGGRIAHVRGLRGLSPYELPGYFDTPGFSVCGHVYDDLELTPKRPIDKLYVARRGSRALANHAEVEAMLTARGYVTYYPEDYPVYEQLAIAQHAKHVVGIHGAGMAGLVLNKQLESFVELLMPHSWHQYYPLVLTGRVKRDAQILSAYDPAISQAGWGAIETFKGIPFPIDLEALEAALDEVGG